MILRRVTFGIRRRLPGGSCCGILRPHIPSLTRFPLDQPSSVASRLEAERKRLHWHSRRGMWELDLLLLPFLEHCYDELDEADQAAYRQLITEEDQDLFMWLMRREWPEEPSRRRIVQMIVDYAETSGHGHNRGL